MGTRQEDDHRLTLMLNIDLAKRLTKLNERLEDLEAALALAHATAPEPRWIVNDLAELGVIVGGRAFFLYKGHSLEYTAGLEHDDGTPMLFRAVGKREFGETCSPLVLTTLRVKKPYGALSVADIDRLRAPYLVGEGWRELGELT